MTLTQHRQQRLGDRQRANKIHLELTTKPVQREVLDRARQRGACVVDQPVQPGVADFGLHFVGHGPDRRGLGHVDVHRGKPLRRRRAQCVAVGYLADTGENPESVAVQHQCAGAADTRG